MEITREHLQEQYQKFLDDDKNLKLVEAQGLTWLEPGFILELFVADFNHLSGLKHTDGIYTRYTAVGRVCSVSPENEGPYARIKAGDIVFVGDEMSHIVKNEAWDEWSKTQTKGQQWQMPEPLKYVRKVFDWISRGRLFYPDRGHVLITTNALSMSAEDINKFVGPYVFKVDIMDVKFKIENPWAYQI